MRTTVIISIVLTIVLVGVAVMILMTHPRRPVSNTNAVTTTTNTNTATTPTPTTTTVVVSPTDAQLQRVARNFAETLGSESSDQPGANFRQAADMASPTYAITLNSQAATVAAGTSHSTVTTAFVVKVGTHTATQATVTVTTQRVTTTGSVTKTQNQDLELDSAVPEWIMAGQ